MGARYKVIVPAVQVTVGARAHFVELDGILPDGVDEATLERFLEEGLVEEVDQQAHGDEESAAAEKAAAEAEAKAKAEADAKAAAEKAAASKKPASGS